MDKEEKYFCHFLFGDKIIQNCLKIDATHLYDDDLLLRQEAQKRLHVLEDDIIIIKKNIDFMSLPERMHFLPEEFEITAIVFVPVITKRRERERERKSVRYCYGKQLIFIFREPYFFVLLSRKTDTGLPLNQGPSGSLPPG